MDPQTTPNGAKSAPMLRLGEHENWLSVELTQRVIDILYERYRPFLSALLGEAATGEAPRARR